MVWEAVISSLNRQRASATNDAPRYGTLVAGLLPSDKHTPTSEKVQIHDDIDASMAAIEDIAYLRQKKLSRNQASGLRVRQVVAIPFLKRIGGHRRYGAQSLIQNPELTFTLDKMD